MSPITYRANDNSRYYYQIVSYYFHFLPTPFGPPSNFGPKSRIVFLTCMLGLYIHNTSAPRRDSIFARFRHPRKSILLSNTIDQNSSYYRTPSRPDFDQLSGVQPSQFHDGPGTYWGWSKPCHYGPVSSVRLTLTFFCVFSDTSENSILRGYAIVS